MKQIPIILSETSHAKLQEKLSHYYQEWVVEQIHFNTCIENNVIEFSALLILRS